MCGCIKWGVPLKASGILAGNEQDVPMVRGSDRLSLDGREPRQEGFRAHVVVDEGGVGELASAARVSRGYLNRLFRTEFGISVASGLESLRCSRAESLLTRTDMTISSIARRCGLADLYHFSHRFVRRYGVPPSAYRDVGTPPHSALDHPGVRRLAFALWG